MSTETAERLNDAQERYRLACKAEGAAWEVYQAELDLARVRVERATKAQTDAWAAYKAAMEADRAEGGKV